MKINANIQVEIDDIEKRKITIETLKKSFDWGDNYYIENNNVMQSVVYHTSHSWADTKRIRAASETDYAIAHILNQL